MPDGHKRRRRCYGNGVRDSSRTKWYALHRQIRFARRFGWEN